MVKEQSYFTVKMFSERILFDNFVFRLHYRWTVAILIFCGFIVTSRLLLGHSFSCKNVDDVSQVYLETKCYTDTVYSLPLHLVKTGDSSLDTADFHSHGYRRYQSFYSWVNILLLIHAFNFYWPHLIWRSYESGFLARLTSGLADCGTSEDKRGSELCFLAKYVLATQGKHKMYTFTYIFCEVCNYSIALVQTLWLVHFFRVTGVPDFVPIKLTTWWNFQQFYFPPSGVCSLLEKKVHHQITCLLPLNKMYMYIFLFLHAWYIFLTIMAGMSLIYRIVLLAPTPRVISLRLLAPLVDKASIKSLCHRLSYSDWFFLIRLVRVMTDIDFAQMLSKIELASTCKGRCSLIQEDNGSFLSEDNHKELESSTATSPV